MSTEKYDSRNDTIEHILRVRELLYIVQNKLKARGFAHDQSKLRDPEKAIFDRMTPKLKGSTYGSDEYKSFLAEMKPALDHHYAHNSHHPEYYGYLECNGCFKRHPLNYSAQCDACGYGHFTARPDVDGMTLLDLIEMLCDWKAAGERHADGSIQKSLNVNKRRFEITDQLQSILQNTAKELGWTT